MPQKNTPMNSKKNPRNRNSRRQQQHRPRHNTHYCHSHGCTAAAPTVLCQHRYPRTIVDIRPEHEDPHRVRITAGGNLLDSGASASFWDVPDYLPLTVIEPRTVPQADHEDPEDQAHEDPAGGYYWNHPGFLPPHGPNTP